VPLSLLAAAKKMRRRQRARSPPPTYRPRTPVAPSRGPKTHAQSTDGGAHKHISWVMVVCKAAQRTLQRIMERPEKAKVMALDHTSWTGLGVWGRSQSQEQEAERAMLGGSMAKRLGDAQRVEGGLSEPGEEGRHGSSASWHAQHSTTCLVFANLSRGEYGFCHLGPIFVRRLVSHRRSRSRSRWHGEVTRTFAVPPGCCHPSHARLVGCCTSDFSLAGERRLEGQHQTGATPPGSHGERQT
jgi:hypothetical protein